jgi:hypothetical protein
VIIGDTRNIPTMHNIQTDKTLRLFFFIFQ